MLCRRASIRLQCREWRVKTSRAEASVIPIWRLSSSLSSAHLDPHQRGNAVDDERDFFLSVLNASTTRRDAKSYISRFAPASSDPTVATGSHSNHVALVKIRTARTLDDWTLDGLVRTFSQLTRLGVSCIVVVDGQPQRIESGRQSQDVAIRRAAAHQAERFASALEKSKMVNARRLDDLLGFGVARTDYRSSVEVRGSVEVQYPELLWRNLVRGCVPIISPVAFTHDTQRIVSINADDAVLAIVRELAGIGQWPPTPANAESTSECAETRPPRAGSPYTLDRLIVLDPAGPIPSTKRTDQTHVFLNMEQEYQDTRDDILRGEGPHERTQQHLDNLDLLRSTLTLLPPSSSAFLTTPWHAATPAPKDLPVDAPGVQTRRPKNPLIFNLLTDKPLISSSLPVARLRGAKTATPTQSTPHAPRATFAKRGMPLTMIPHPETHPWQRPTSDRHCMSLEDPRIDFSRLLHLIEDSFNRPLDVSHYLGRIRNRIAGIIVAGEYEGGAILTWELPPGVPDDGSEDSRARMVPYLDKFAVLKRSQGAGGVADIVFSAMVRSCFPEGVCWRSRRDNPVNKWYFERSVGTLKIPGSDWTMFWTNQDLQSKSQQWRDYQAVCRTVPPSWADNLQKLD